MIAFAGLLRKAGQRAGMSVPEEIVGNEIDAFKDTHTHFYVFCAVQIGTGMPNQDSHYKNAELIAKLSDEEIEEISPAELIERGFEHC